MQTRGETDTDPDTDPRAPLPHLALSRSSVPRRAELRGDPELFARLLSDPSTRILEIADGHAPVVDGERLDLRPPNGEDRESVAALAFLGQDSDGVAYLCRQVDEAAPTWVTLRDVGTVLDDRDAGLMAQAVALANWHATHQRCPRCGSPTRPAQAGWTRLCTNDGSEHYPRTDPAVIMAVIDADDRLLLGHGSIWPPGRFSTLAGFVEPGESLEAAVRREVWEEVGVEIGDVHYRGSQPWPFPASVMLGFRAYATTTAIDVDGSEIDDARWFTREGLIEAVEAGEVLMSPSISIARRLIEDWYGGPIASSPAAESWRPAGT